MWSGCHGDARCRKLRLLRALQSEKEMEPQLPSCFRWSCRDVGGWVRRKGFPQYEACFTENGVTGQKLIHVTCSTLPRMGVTDCEHVRTIARLVRELLGVTEPSWGRSISLPRRDNMGLFLEQKSQTGAHRELLSYSQFIREQGL
ncbi:sterile alpha motif domain-containing protein 15 [Anomaloglossus baeobatrachus]|uniref:sterile alpha motif domain-containing protein 15 n=1 Tax=Anomaloglossus baeobatrachus TaxID=238106 RepID=UPI003F500572